MLRASFPRRAVMASLTEPITAPRHALDGLDDRPAQHLRALLGDVPAGHLDVGLAVPRSQPGPAAQLGTARNRCMSPISATMTAASTGPTPDHLIAAVTGEHFRGHPGQHGDLTGQLAGQVPQRGHLPGVGLGQAQAVQPCRPGRTEVSEQVTWMPSLASTAWTWFCSWSARARACAVMPGLGLCRAAGQGAGCGWWLL